MKLMLEGEAMKGVTQDAGIFKLIMSSLSKYKRLVGMLLCSVIR